MDDYPPWSYGNGVVCGGGGGGVAVAVGGEGWLWRREKWVKHYSSEHQILLVGEGDFSFSLSLAMGFGSASNIVATSLDSYDTLQRNYVRASANLEILRSLGATLLHGVDATKMSYHMRINYKKFDRIVFNFPHAGFYGKENNPRMIEMHKDLLRGFFSNASLLLQHDGEIHVSHKNAAPYCDWNLEQLARENSLHLLERVPFNIADYPYYQNKRGHGWHIDMPFNLGDCSTFKFTASALISLLFNFNKSTTNHLISNDQISFEPNTVINRDPFIPKDSINFNMGMEKSLPLLKFIVKGSLRFYPRAAGFAGALMGPENSIIAIIYGPVDHYDSNFVELLAIKHALFMFERSHLLGKVALVVESGSSDAVSWIKSDMVNPWELQAVVNEIRGALGRIGNADVCCKYWEYGVETHQNVVDKWTELGFDKNSTVELWC